jgi:CHAT domain
METSKGEIEKGRSNLLDASLDLESAAESIEHWIKRYSLLRDKQYETNDWFSDNWPLEYRILVADVDRSIKAAKGKFERYLTIYPFLDGEWPSALSSVGIKKPYEWTEGFIFFLTNVESLLRKGAKIAKTKSNLEATASPVVPVPSIGRGQSMEKIRILLVPANPASTPHLRLDEEVHEIEAKILGSAHRDSLELVTKWAVRPDDLLQSLNQYKPHVVHFSGHGSSTEEIILLDQAGNPKPVSKQALVSLFRTLKDNIRVVLLNACFSRPQAEAITEEIDCAIGMSRAIGDRAAITFAAAFYRAIGFGRTVKEAFEQGKTALLLEGIPGEHTPTLITRKNINADTVALVNPQVR